MELGFKVTYCHFMRNVSITDIATLTDIPESEIKDLIKAHCQKQCPIVYKYLAEELVVAGRDLFTEIRENISVFIPPVNTAQKELAIADVEQLPLKDN